MKTAHSSSRSISGFSLVEIALALGVVGFSMAALLGLLGAASTVNAESGRDTVMVSMTAQIMTELRAAPFDALWDEEPQVAAQGVFTPSNSDPEDTTYYFTVEGTPIEASKGENDPSAVYMCTVKKVPDEASKTPTNNRYNMLRVRLIYTWPVGSPAANRQTHTIHATIARY